MVQWEAPLVFLGSHRQLWSARSLAEWKAQDGPTTGVYGQVSLLAVAPSFSPWDLSASNQLNQLPFWHGSCKPSKDLALICPFYLPKKVTRSSQIEGVWKQTPCLHERSHKILWLCFSIYQTVYMIIPITTYVNLNKFCWINHIARYLISLIWL